MGGQAGFAADLKNIKSNFFLPQCPFSQILCEYFLFYNICVFVCLSSVCVNWWGGQNIAGQTFAASEPWQADS